MLGSTVPFNAMFLYPVHVEGPVGRGCKRRVVRRATLGSSGQKCEHRGSARYAWVSACDAPRRKRPLPFNTCRDVNHDDDACASCHRPHCGLYSLFFSRLRCTPGLEASFVSHFWIIRLLSPLRALPVTAPADG